MNEYRIRKARPIAAEMRVPGDKSISHRAVLLAALANGPSVITGFLPAAECLCTINACRALGVQIDFLSADDNDFPWMPDEKNSGQGPVRLRVHGTSMKLKAPGAAVDCGNSGTALTLLSGILAGQPFVSRLLGDEDDSQLSLHSIAGPLEAMGVPLKSSGPGKTAPFIVEGNPALKAVAHKHPLTNSRAKGAVLLAGLYARGKTTVIEASPTRDHTERLLRHFQVKTRREGLAVSIYGGQMPESRDFAVPGDISFAANWITAAAAQPGSDLTVRGAGLNDTRTGFLRILVRMGAQIMEEINDTRSGEPYGSVIVRGAPLRGVTIQENEVASLSDELPVLAVAAALAHGRTLIHQTPEESERLTRTAHNLRLMGVEVATLPHGIEIIGGAGAALLPGCVPSYGDRRIAMAFAVAGLFADGETIVEDVTCVESTYHGFHEELKRFQARGISEGHSTPVIASVPYRGDRKMENAE